MLEKYLRKGETIESRLDELMTDARASGNPTLNANRYAEAQVLAAVAQTLLAPEPQYATIQTESGWYRADDVAEALDNAFEGGQAPVALKGAVLALLAGNLEHDRLAAFVADSSLVPDDADGRSAMVEYSGVPDGPRPTIDRSGVDFEETIPEHNADEELADDFPEFAEPEADPLEATTKKTKKGGKKTTAQRAAEEAGL